MEQRKHNVRRCAECIQLYMHLYDGSPLNSLITIPFELARCNRLRFICSRTKVYVVRVREGILNLSSFGEILKKNPRFHFPVFKFCRKKVQNDWRGETQKSRQTNTNKDWKTETSTES